MGLQSYQHVSPKRLARLVKNGEEDVWEEVARRHYEPILHWMTAKTGDVEVALDLTQETFIDAYRHRQRLLAGKTLGPWLNGIARYNLLSYWRRRYLITFLSIEALSERSSHPMAHGQYADEALQAIDEGGSIDDTFDRLPPLLREALSLSAAQGLTAEEIARSLHISSSAAEKRVARAKHAFRANYTESG